MKYDIKNEFDKLVKNGWITEEEASNFAQNSEIKNCMELSTSPEKPNIFNALFSTPFEKVKVVILGKDPYPNPKDAHGLAFSSKNNVTPDSLKNIFKVIDEVYGSNLLEKGKNDLTKWAQNGILLLNTGLTYQKIINQTLDTKQKNSLQSKLQNKNMRVWKPFINAIIRRILSINNRPVVMMLWGNDAHNIVFSNIKNKEFKNIYLHSRDAVIVPNTSVMLLQTAHPSPLSVNTGGDFMETGKVHFRLCDEYLKNNKVLWSDI